jgi:IS30 family transposase
MAKRCFRQLTKRDRRLIYEWRKQGLSQAEIARRLGKDKSTISRELKRNAEVVTKESRLFWFKIQKLWTDDQLDAYLKTLPANERKALTQTELCWRPQAAQACRDQRVWMANQKRRRKKPATRKWVIEKLKLHWSPEQIAGRSKVDGPQPVSHEYIYELLHRDKLRGGRLYRLLKRFRRRKQRFARRQYPSERVIPNRVGIEKRPAAANRRERLGDCEADLITGHRHSGYVLSFIDRKSKLLVLRKLKTKRSPLVRKQMEVAIRQLGRVLTLTVDNGREFVEHRKLTWTTGVRVYFAHPHCSAERGTVENANGLVRYYLPKRKSFANLSQRELNRIQNLLNRRPRKCLGYLTPAEAHSRNRSLRPTRKRCI